MEIIDLDEFIWLQTFVILIFIQIKFRSHKYLDQMNHRYE